VLINI